MMAITTIFTLGRVYANIRRLGLSDVLVLLATILNIAHGSLMIAYVKYFRHTWNAPLCWITGEFMMVSYVWQVIYFLNQFLTKTAILLWFYEFFTVSNTMRWAIRGGIAFAFVLYSTGLAMSSYYLAPHTGSNWDELIFESFTCPHALSLSCNIRWYWGIAQATVNTTFDLYLLILPLPFIYRLTLSPNKKLQIADLFPVAFLGVIASIISLAYRVLSKPGSRPDTLYNDGIILLCNLSETSATLMVCTIPAFSRFVRVEGMGSRLFKRMRPSWSPDDSERSDWESEKYAQGPNNPRTWLGNSDKRTETLRNTTEYIGVSDTWLLYTGVSAADLRTSSQPVESSHKEGGLRVATALDRENGPTA
ncbi:hypothetical protein B0I35DRAFT_475706 [Stachybotrys elegans]|uniref:Rhodopsin domain-containing protein n=1 Tax=Stachybotrys elegans TaxID=80388 RepID=A0A8K0T2K5_9HYPO|nr:hypothetical protein B0I35DRAFT_475706 [Stachybotrys elegans]